jgi:hypothetical protein
MRQIVDGSVLINLAKDIYDAVSLQESYYIQIEAHIEIRIHLGYGVGATVTVKNLGVKDYKHIPWYFNFNLRLDPHKSRLLKLKLGTLWSLKAGEERTFRECIFRFTLRGWVAFGLKFEALPSEYWLEDQCNCKIIGPFVYTYPLLYS